MIRAFIFLLLLAAVPAAAQPSSWRSDVPCTAGRNAPLTVGPESEVAEVPGCARAHCASTPDGRRVCSCTSDTGDILRVEVRGRVIQEWPAEYSVTGPPQSLRLIHGDLDGDGRAETVISEWLDQSNGLGINYHRLTILDGRDPARTPTVLAVEDFEPEGAFVRPAGGGDCRLIATDWDELRMGNQVRMYFIGRWMRYRDGRLEHDPDRPIVARRLSNSFNYARFGTPGAPFAHLHHRDAEARPELTAGILPPLAGRQAGTIRDVSDGWTDTVTVALASGETARYALGEHFREDFSRTASWLVDGATRRLYPQEYAPSARAWLDGAPVTVVTYADGEGQTVNLLILGTRTP